MWRTPRSEGEDELGGRDLNGASAFLLFLSLPNPSFLEKLIAASLWPILPPRSRSMASQAATPTPTQGYTIPPNLYI